jgi:ataxia telangiectasia mutated family protein
MLVWLEATLNGILQHDAIAKQIVDPAIAMWPRPLPAALNERVAELEMKRLVELAEDVANPYPGKFDLSSRLVDALSASTRSSDSSSVTERTFWALRNAMPIELRSSAASAFIDLFYVAPWHLQAPELPMLTAAMSEPWLKEAPATLDPRGSLLAMLMTCLDGDRLELRHMAYRTLVSLVSGNQSVRDGHGLSRSDKKELLLVGELPQLPMETGKSDLAVLINSDEWANLHHRDTSEWVAAFAPLIAMAAGKRDPFYSRLGPLLKVEGGLAEKMLPALMQGALAMDYENTVSRDIISRYLQQVLASSSTPTPSLRIIIAVILHLQAIQPPWLSSRLASDAWLEVDFLTLTRAALRCKAYASALRFLETARDVDSPAGKYAERNFDYHEVRKVLSRTRCR